MFMKNYPLAHAVTYKTTHWPTQSREYVVQWVVLNNQQNICLGVRQLTLTDFVTEISGALSPRHALP